MAIRFVVNGDAVAVDDVPPDTTLLEWLRRSGRTGTKEGCAEGECGACAVAMLRRDGEGSRLESINSCLVPLGGVADRKLWTVEGIARGSDLHPVQRAMVQRGGSQCGYCTPGFVVSLFCEYYRPGRTAYDPAAIGGNLCRCTGYRPIADVAREMPAVAAGDAMAALLQTPCAEPTATTHLAEGRRFERPRSLPELFASLAASRGATMIAGGTDLMVRRNQFGERFAHLVSIEAIPELHRFDWTDREIILGASLPLAVIEERLQREHRGELPMLERLLELFSSRLIRHRATLGGNLGTASPIGDALPVLLSLDAELTIAASAGMRRIKVRDFLVGYRKNALAPGEVVVSVHLPRPVASIQRFYKVSKRELDDISTVSAAFALELDDARRVVRFHAAYGGVGPTPLRAEAVEAEALGRAFDRSTLARMLAAAKSLATPMTDHRGSAAYRRAMVGRLLEKLFYETADARDQS